MSRVGISNNIIQPDARCMSCKRWKSASNKELSKDGKEILRKGQKRRVAEDLQAFLSGMEDK